MNNKETIRAYNLNHKEEIAAWQKVYYQKHKEEQAVLYKVYYQEHKEEIKVHHKAYNLINKNRIKARDKAFKQKNYLHITWYNMINRCYNPKRKGYKYWGGRGISVCQRWLDSFEDFREDVGERPTSKHSIDRIDNGGNYEPGNVKWSTRKEHNINRGPYKRRELK